MRRRITGVGEPGTFGGRHHSTYREEIAAMFALGQVLAVEELLLGLLDAVEDEVAERRVRLDPTFFLTLADLYQDSGRTEDLHALRERFGAAEERARSMPADDPVPDDGLASLVPKGATLLAGEGRTAPPVGPPPPVVAPSVPLVAAESGIAPAPGLAPAAPAPAGGSAPGARAGPEPGLEPDIEAPLDGGEVPDNAEATPVGAPGPRRELTPVERMIRGPRVRSL